MSYLDTHGLETLWTKIKGLVSGKQDTISDLATIRSNATAGAAKISCTDSAVSGFGYLKKSGILDLFYPVGTVYETTVSSFDPNTSWGGTWVKIEGQFLLGSSSAYSIGTSGGSADSTLPSHTHSVPALSGSAASAGGHYHSIPSLSGYTYSEGSHTHSIPALSGSAESAGAHTHSYGYYVQRAASGSARHTPGSVSGGDGTYQTSSAGSHTHSVTTDSSTTGSGSNHSHSLYTNSSSTGSESGHTHSVSTNASTTGSSGKASTGTNMPPYVAVNIWKRTA